VRTGMPSSSAGAAISIAPGDDERRTRSEEVRFLNQHVIVDPAARIQGGRQIEVEGPFPRRPRFMGKSTCTSRIGSNPKRSGIRLRMISMILRAASSASVASKKKKSPPSFADNPS
jgi:hypothetical protein